TATVMQILTDQLRPICLAIGLLLSIVLSFMASALAPRDTGKAKPWMRTVWTGQILIGVGGLLMLLPPLHPVFGFLFAVACCLLFAVKLRRQLRPMAGVVN